MIVLIKIFKHFTLADFEDIMDNELKLLAIRVGFTLLITPLMGYALMICAEKFERTWKTNNRKKRWLATCGAFLILAALSGWFI